MLLLVRRRCFVAADSLAEIDDSFVIAESCCFAPRALVVRIESALERNLVVLPIRARCNRQLIGFRLFEANR